MMDDSMEISSEHGHNIRDEDIDIDIDLTTGHGDEDYILEDALPHQTVDDEFLFEAPQAPGNDDLMVDEDGDNEAYHMNEVDPDLLPDNSNQNMIAEIDTVSFMTANDHSPYQEQHDVLDAGHIQAASVGETEVAEGHKDAPNGYTANAHVDPQSHEEPATHEDEGNIETVNTAETEVENATALPTNNIHSPSPSTHNNSPKVPAFSEHPKSPNNLPKPTEESQDHIVGGDQLDTAVPHEHDAGLQVESEESYPTDDLDAHPVPEILVLYQETEYGLFSTSELDDPDSFFLSDTSVLDNPISNFLTAMRDVIHEDLSNDDELCLSIGDMGIEVEEMSTLIQDVTLRQILNLYEGLLRNDGVDSPRPFYMQLGVRPNFAKRLGSLATGFREGKGLSELIPMVEHSNSPEASLEEARDKHRGDSKTEEFEREEFDDVAEEYDDVQDNPEISQVVAHEADLKSSNLVGNSSDKPGEHQSNDLTTVLSPEAESAQIVGGSGNGKYEEDLIDYSDEEVERPEKQKKPNEIASDEEHFVDSVPGSTKDTLPEQSAPYAEPSDIDDEVHKEEAGIGYEEENDESYYLETEVHEEATAYDETETWEHEGNIELLVSQNGLEANGESNDLESDHEEPEDEIGYDEGHDAETRDLYDEDLGLEGSTEKPLEEERAINHALSNLASSENGTSEKTLEGSAGADETPEDEIDYDDDDDLATSGAQESLPGGDVSVSIDGSGKRQREDANLDEGMSMRSKDAKRRKS